MLTPPIGLLGGTFDPIHLGHIKPALAARDALGLGELRLLPNRVPPHRASPHCSAEQRLAMVHLAANEFGLCVDERELRRDRPSWTIDTLEELRHELPETPLCFLMGMDSLLSLPSWHRWDELLTLAHLVVSVRPGWDAAEATTPVQALLAHHGTLRVDDLHQRRAGHIWLAHNEPLALSSTEIRARLAAGNDPRDLLPESVADYIRNNGLYVGKSGPVL
ncbi:nicotinate-nucleotide adenylyltransferase [Aeromonas schubertii]|uniref:Probable nicotinate-nucleotide adenylyltransferase n=1 Tax=Aeromonas schubertii TaxID=652 RepID=A0A0S2SME7_9GAMM|nr:nicotinate-nucleotide adenylyltransferase [Aeromonas schubertii]ALP42838.1 nicotinate (nicotinamide) nucleotide adenylyltransferase [Aeromonas schubertii]MBZ6065495.1 nicotinate-nucleotide adenylyltransferase [Aeromonas schubertii]MBZ6072247.1 nicotinate-nucleotide adenylyltransferase [Aeromonas schubertii]